MSEMESLAIFSDTRFPDKKIGREAHLASCSLEYISPGLYSLERLLFYDRAVTKDSFYFDKLLTRMRMEELHARAIPELTTVGVEFERHFPHTQHGKDSYNKLAPHLRNFTRFLEIPTEEKASYFEFCMPFSYSWKVQRQLLFELCRLGLVPFQPSQNEDTYRGYVGTHLKDNSLHLNIAYPKEVMVLALEKKDLQQNSDLLATLMGLAYTPLSRLQHRKTSAPSSINRATENSVKSSGRLSFGRVEIRPLGFGGRYSFKQLEIGQLVGSAFMQSLVEPSVQTERSRLLRQVWEDCNEEGMTILDSYEVKEHCLVRLHNQSRQDQNDILRVIRDTPMREELRNLLNWTAKKVEKVIF